MATCPKHGYYEGGIFATCPRCETNELIEKNTEATRSAAEAYEQTVEDMEWQLQEHRAEQERMIGEALEEQKRIAEATIEEQRRIAEEATEEHERIASEAWQLEAQKKAEQAGKLFNSGLFEESLKLSLSAISSDPSCITAYLWASDSSAEIRDHQGTMAYLTKALKLLQSTDYKNNVHSHKEVLSCIVKISKNQELVQKYLDILQSNFETWGLERILSVLSLHKYLLENIHNNNAAMINEYSIKALHKALQFLQVNHKDNIYLHREVLLGIIQTGKKQELINKYIEIITNNSKTWNLSKVEEIFALCRDFFENSIFEGVKALKTNMANATNAGTPINLMIPVLIYEVELDNRLGIKNEGSKLDDYLETLDREITNKFLELKEAFKKVKVNKNISEGVIHILRNKIKDRYEKVWKRELNNKLVTKAMARVNYRGAIHIGKRFPKVLGWIAWLISVVPLTGFIGTIVPRPKRHEFPLQSFLMLIIPILFGFLIYFLSLAIGKYLNKRRLFKQIKAEEKQPYLDALKELG